MARPIKLKSDDPSLSLALAMVCVSSTPLLLLDGKFKVIAASASLCDAFDLDPTTAVGQPLFSLGAGEWEAPQLRSLMDATRREKNARPDSRHLLGEQWRAPFRSLALA